MNSQLNQYLQTLSENLSLSVSEKEKIEKSITVLKHKIAQVLFDDGLREVKPFGSYDRETLLSRNIDLESDVDLLVVFDQKRWQSQTYLSKLKQFSLDNYPQSEHYQDYPTIALELDHIKFELVPCIYKAGGFIESEKYLIPSKKGSTLEWIRTEPNEIKEKISKVKDKDKLIRMILLFKYWNIVNLSSYKTYQVERFVIHHFDSSEPLVDNFFRLIMELSDWNSNQRQIDTNRIAKAHRKNVKTLLEHEMSDYALTELKKMIPELS